MFLLVYDVPKCLWFKCSYVPVMAKVSMFVQVARAKNMCTFERSHNVAQHTMPKKWLFEHWYMATLPTIG